MKFVICDDGVTPVSSHTPPVTAGLGCHQYRDERRPMQTLTRDNVKLAFVESGTGDPPLLFVHCWGCDHSFFAPQLDHFGRRHRAIAVDLRGHGASDKPQQDYTLSTFAADLIWTCEQLELERPVVIGHSMGGNTAVELAARYPDFAAAIVMIDSVIVPPPALAEALREAAPALRGPDFREVVRNVAQGVTLSTDDPVRTRRLVEVMASSPQHVMSSAFENHLIEWDGASALKACRVPALYIAAANPITDLQAMKDLCPQLMVGQTVGAGHFNLQEVPEQVNAMIERFLKLADLGA
jgi:pimeloyl-ACP methyl ester carboxylesterase